MSNKLSRLYNTVRNFLFSSVNKEFLIFSFFLALSCIFWLMMTLNETYEKEICVPIQLTNVPENAVITTEMEDTIHVMVRDKGYTLATYMYGEGIKPLRLNFNTYANRQSGYGSVPVADVTKLAYQRLFNSSKITQIKPEKLDFYFNFGELKVLPIRMTGTVVPNKSFYLARARFWPNTVTVYAKKQILDSLKHIRTSPLNIVNFSDTVIRSVPLERIKGVKIVPSTVRIGLYPDILTEESIEVPIKAINMPSGKVLRTFPSKIKVSFTIGASMFRRVSAQQFSLVVDYNEIITHPSNKCNVYLHTSPHGVRNAKLEISQVDYLIEQM